MSLTNVRSQSNLRSPSLTASKASKNPPPLAAASPTREETQFWESRSNEVLAHIQKLRSTSPEDPFAIHKIVTWKKMAKDQSLALRTHDRLAAYFNHESQNGTDLVDKLPLEDDDSSQRVRVNPVTMEEMIILPRPTSPKRVEKRPAPEKIVAEECSPNKAYMIRNGGFPGSSHIVGENAFLLMSSIY
jgi:hypothetical protein